MSNPPRVIQYQPNGGPSFEHAQITTMQAVAWLTCSLRECVGAAADGPDGTGDLLDALLQSARYADLLGEKALHAWITQTYALAKDPRRARMVYNEVRKINTEWEQRILRENNTQYIPVNQVT